MTEEKSIRIKRLTYRSNNRGWKETDLLLGKFALEYLHRFTDNELDDFERLLEESDPDIFGWVTGKQAIPAEFDTGVMKTLRQFKLV